MSIFRVPTTERKHNKAKRVTYFFGNKKDALKFYQRINSEELILTNTGWYWISGEVEVLTRDGWKVLK